MMAAMLYPDRRVMAVCGDGGFMMNSQELETAVRLKLNLVVLIIQDDAYGMIRWKQAVDSFADFGLTFGNPDFVKYAEAYGAKGRRVEVGRGAGRRRSRRRSARAASSWSPCRWTTARTPACSWTSCATACRLPQTPRRPTARCLAFPAWALLFRYGYRSSLRCSVWRGDLRPYLPAWRVPNVGRPPRDPRRLCRLRKTKWWPRATAAWSLFARYCQRQPKTDQLAAAEN